MRMKSALALLLTTVCATQALAKDVNGVSLRRVLTVPLEAEITGLTTYKGDLFVNYQHPTETNVAPFNKAGVGVIANADFEAAAQPVPTGEAQQKVQSTLGDWQLIVNAGEDGMGVIDGATSDSPDFNSFIATGENEGYLFTNWEERPGGMSRIQMKRDANGMWTKIAGEMLDFTGVKGTWVNCFGSTTPWNTPLSSEELYFDNTADWNNPNFKKHNDQLNMAKYLGGTYPNPYDYGYIVEITEPTGAAKPVKRFAMGRFSHENGFVMPDQKTVYLSDDGTNTVLYKFSADTAADLSSGTLYAAKVTQNGDAGAMVNDVTFDIEWIKLAHGSEADIAGWVREYDGITPDDYGTDKTYITDDEIAAWAAGTAADDRVAFLESRKAATAKGATAEFRKMEGVAYNGENVFVAMTEITKGMADGEGDIRLKANPCGAVFKLTVDETYNAVTMQPFVVGGPYDEAAAPNACSVDSISSPDNVLALTDGSVLIGEDSGDHENNMLWLAK